jgi:hypothetical protein
MIASEANDTSWSAFNTQTCVDAAYQMRFDSVHRIMYTANAAGGFWALKVP